MIPDEQGPETLSERLRRLLAKLLLVWRGRAWPIVKTWLGAVYITMRQRVLPAVGTSSTRLKGELVRIHRQQNWAQRCSTTLSGNAAGLGMAMLSTKVVESMVETREMSNLWGLLADRPVVSETTFEVLSFSVEYLLALIVFTITEYYIAEYQRKRESSQQGDAVTNDDGAG